jgi:hypothetical protein
MAVHFSNLLWKYGGEKMQMQKKHKKPFITGANAIMQPAGGNTLPKWKRKYELVCF